MVEEQIDSEVFATHFERVLTADEGEADAEFEKEFPKVLQKARLQLFLAGGPSEGEKVRVLEDLLRKIRLWRRQGLREVRLRLSLAAVEAALDLVDEDVPAPAVLQRGPHVPFPGAECFSPDRVCGDCGLTEFVQQPVGRLTHPAMPQQTRACIAGWPGESLREILTLEDIAGREAVRPGADDEGLKAESS